MKYSNSVQNERDLSEKLALLQEESIKGIKSDLNEALIGTLLALLNDDAGKYRHTSFVVALQDTNQLDDIKDVELFEEVYRLKVEYKNNKPIFYKSTSINNVYEDNVMGVIVTQLQVKSDNLYKEVSYDFIYNLATLKNVTMIMFEDK